MLNRYVFNGRSIICVSPTSRETEDTLCVLPRGGTMSLKARHSKPSITPNVVNYSRKSVVTW